MGTQLYNEPCKNCGSANQLLIITNDKKTSLCQNCNHMEDLYVSPELQKQWDNESKQNTQQQTIEEHKNNKPTIECPYCHSTDTKKISNTSKAFHTAVFGIFSMGRNSKNFHCNNCGADF